MVVYVAKTKACDVFHGFCVAAWSLIIGFFEDKVVLLITYLNIYVIIRIKVDILFNYRILRTIQTCLLLGYLLWKFIFGINLRV